MKRIYTSETDWQKKMEECMRKREKFILVTKDENLARLLEKNSFTVETLKLILLGSASITGLSGAALVAAVTSLLAATDPEPITKVLLAALATICLTFGAYYLYRLVRMLVNKQYIFKLQSEKPTPSGEWEILALPVDL